MYIVYCIFNEKLSIFIRVYHRSFILTSFKQTGQCI